MWSLNLLPADDDGQPATLLYAPPAPPRGLLVCVHGYTRQPLEQAEAFLPLAAEHGWALLLPVFDERRHRRYAQLRQPRRGLRADLALIARIEALALTHALPMHGWHLFGYSAGAQFAHRFALLHAHRLRAVALGAAGWYTWPDSNRAWPFGTAGLEPAGQAASAGFLRLPKAIWVGADDDGPDRYLRDEPELSGWQGAGRLERARRWRAAVSLAAARLGHDATPALHTIAGAGHSFVACQRRGRLAQAVMHFFATAGEDPYLPAGAGHGLPFSAPRP